LQEIILRCLEIDARDRYASAAQVAFDLANPTELDLSERANRDRTAGLRTRIRRWIRARKFEPAPCPPPSSEVGHAPIVLVALEPVQADARLLEALRDAARKLIAVNGRCRIACVTAVPSATSLSGERYEETATGRHIKHLIELRRWARPLELPEERVTYHVLESEKPAAALIDYARINGVEEIVIGASHGGPPTRLFPGVAAQVVAEAPCTVTVVRARADA
jgi:nucleotide-binding universal stress UspA family protein